MPLSYLSSCGCGPDKPEPEVPEGTSVSIEEAMKHAEVDNEKIATFQFDFAGSDSIGIDCVFLKPIDRLSIVTEKIKVINHKFVLQVKFNDDIIADEEIKFSLNFSYYEEKSQADVKQNINDLSVIVKYDPDFTVEVKTEGVYLTQYSATEGVEFSTYVFLNDYFYDFKSLTVKVGDTTLTEENDYDWDPWYCQLTVHSDCVLKGLSIEAELYYPELSKPFAITNTSEHALDFWVDHMSLSHSAPNLEYSFDNGEQKTWENYVNDSHLDIPVGGTIYLQGINNNGWSTSSVDTNEIGIQYKPKSGSKDDTFKLSGNIMSLVNKEYYPYMLLEAPEYCFYKLFANSRTDYEAKLTDASDLIIPTYKLGDYCCYWMFHGNASLVNAPQIYASQVGKHACAEMFRECTELVNPPLELSAIDLTDADLCYGGMFAGCSKLTSAPYIRATTLADSCFRGMFSGCTSLKEIKIDYTGQFTHSEDDENDAFLWWTLNVASSGNFYYKGQDLTYSGNAIPIGWNVISE